MANFEFSLSGRTDVPSRKITDMVQFSTDRLRKEAKTIKDIEKRDNKTIQITDMSSHGSYILRRYLGSHAGF